MDEEQSEECCNGVLERERSRLMNGAHSVSPSVSGSFQDDNLCTMRWFLWVSLLRGTHIFLTLLSVSSPLTSFPLQPDSGPGPLLLAGYEDGSLLLWDVTQRSRLSLAKVHPEPVMCLTFDTERLRGISGSSEKTLSSWRLDRQNNLQVSTTQLGELCLVQSDEPTEQLIPFHTFIFISGFFMQFKS